MKSTASRPHALPILIGLGLVLATCQIGRAQSWPVNNPSFDEPVPQYSPRYPLTPTTPPAPQEVVPPQLPEAPAIDVREQPIAIPQLEPSPVVNVGAHVIEKTQPKVNWDIYRNRNSVPVDPRKPCNHCTHPGATQPRFAGDLAGLNGRPHSSDEPGGCTCNQKNPGKHPEFSVYWPRPLSAKIDEHFPERAADRDSPCQKKRLVDVFDGLSNFKLVNYQRTDNGYCGRGADPYGCLGESKFTGTIGTPIEFER